VQLDSPIFQRWIENELRELFVADGLDFWNNECRRFTDLCEQVLNLANPCEILVIRAVLRQLQRRVVIDAFDFQLERLLELKHVGQRLRRFPHSTLPLLKFRIRPLKPGKILLPFSGVGKEMREILLVVLGNFRACWDLFSRHFGNTLTKPTTDAKKHALFSVVTFVDVVRDL